nr:MAG: terminase large subunit [Caudoviricetes sp.]
MSIYTHKVPWLPKEHTVIDGYEDMANFYMFKDYADLIESGQQHVSEDIHKLFTYLYKVVLTLDIYLDVTATEAAYQTPKKYFPHDLFPWERFLIPFIFGLRFKSDDTLVFNEYFLYMARGAGKNYFMSWIIFALITNINGIKKYNVAISSASERQAKTSYIDIREVIKGNPKLKKNFPTSTQKEMKSASTNSDFRYLSSNGNTMDGQRLGAAYLDEIHAIVDYASLQVMRSSLGKIPDKRLFITSTDGYTRGKVLDDYKDKSDDVLNGIRGVHFDVANPNHSRLLPFIHRIDNENEARTEIGWQKANPSILYNANLMQTYREEVAEIDVNPELNIEFHLKRLNFVKEDTRFRIAKVSQIAATAQRDITYYRDTLGMRIVGGTVDYSTSRDLTTVGIVGRYENEFYLLQHSFITHEQRHLGQINETLLQEAEARNELTVVNGEVISEQYVVKWFLEQLEQGWIIDTIYIDQYKSAVLGKALEDSGFIVKRNPTNMKYETMVSPLIDRMFANGEIFAGDSPLFRWACNNVYKEVLSRGVRYDKIDPIRRKTDPFSSFLAYLIGTVDVQETQLSTNFTGMVV